MNDIEEHAHLQRVQMQLAYAFRLYCNKYGKPLTRDECISVRLGLYQGGATEPRYPVPSTIVHDPFSCRETNNMQQDIACLSWDTHQNLQVDLYLEGLVSRMSAQQRYCVSIGLAKLALDLS